MIVGGALAASVFGGIAAGIDPRFGLGVLGAVLLTVWVVAKPYPAVLVLAVIAPVTSGLARGFPVPGLKISEALTVIVAVSVLLLPVARYSTRWRFFDWAALAYVVLHFAQPTLVSRVNGSVPTMAEEGVLLGPLQFFLFYRAIRALACTEERRAQLLRAAVWAGLPVALLAVAQTYLPPLSDLLHQLTGFTQQSWNSSRAQRTTSVFPHFQVLSAYLFALIALTVAVIQHGDRVMPRKYSVPIAAVAGLALLQTLTFTSILGTIAALVGFAIWAARPERHVGAVAGALVFLAILVAPQLAQRISEQRSVTQGTVGSERPAYVPQSVAFRYEVWTNQSIPALSDHWATGVGATVPHSVAWRSTESMYVTLLFRGGVLLVATWALLWFAFFEMALPRARDGNPAVSTAARFLVLVIPLLAVMNLIQPYFTYGGSTHLLWLAAALIAATTPDVARSGQDVDRV